MQLQKSNSKTVPDAQQLLNRARVCIRTGASVGSGEFIVFRESALVHYRGALLLLKKASSLPGTPPKVSDAIKRTQNGLYSYTFKPSALRLNRRALKEYRQEIIPMADIRALDPKAEPIQ